MIGSVVCYDNRIKTDWVGVAPETLRQHGAVSSETAIAMAQGIRDKFASDIGIGITGIAGPDGGSEAKPVGLVYLAIAGPHGVIVEEEHFSGQRGAIKTRAVNSSLDLLRRYIQKQK